MRILFMGTPEFAARSLERLYADGHELCGVFTQPDKPVGRGMKLAVSPVKQLAGEMGTPVFQPKTLKDGAVLEQLRELNPEIIILVAYGQLLPKTVLELPPLGCVNIHGSVLPKYRGAAPVQWAVINGERLTGVTSMYMAEELDTGDIIYTAETEIRPDETSGELLERLSHLGAELLSKTLRDIESGQAVRRAQDGSQATYAPMLTREMSEIDWTKSAEQVKNHVRGLQPWPGATAVLGGKRVKVLRAGVKNMKTGLAPGSVAAAGKDGLLIACGGGTVLEIIELQAEGKKSMAAADYLRGNNIECTERLK